MIGFIFIYIAVMIYIIYKFEKNSKRKTSTTNIKQIQNQEIKQNEQEKTQSTKFPYYLVTTVLSTKEQAFYRTLKPIADELGLIIFSKMRIVDIVNVPQNHPEYIKWFNYVKAKHIDFILCDQNFKIYKLIEVDDYTHQYKKRQERDIFVNEIFQQLNVDLLRYYQWTPEQLRKDLIPQTIQVQQNNLTYTP